LIVLQYTGKSVLNYKNNPDSIEPGLFIKQVFLSVVPFVWSSKCWI